KDSLEKLKQAREIAARLVGGDPSNVPVCHPLRWPGSWHRKGSPRLCEIETNRPDQEIGLDEALAVLKAREADIRAKLAHFDTLIAFFGLEDFARKWGRTKAQPSEKVSGVEGWKEPLANIARGEDLHNSIAVLAAKLVAAGTDDGAAVNLLRTIVRGSPRWVNDLRWMARYNDIP